MRAVHIKIENLRAFLLFESELPSVCILQGTHGSGTSKSGMQFVLGEAVEGDLRVVDATEATV